MRTSVIVVVAFLVGLLSATLFSGCSKPADRTLTVYQLQSMDTYDGKFRIDTSELPPDAILATADTGGSGDPITRIELNLEYEVEIVLRILNPQQ